MKRENISSVEVEVILHRHPGTGKIQKFKLREAAGSREAITRLAGTPAGA